MYYSDAVLKLNGRNTRKIANNTYLERDTVGTDIYVRLHSTRIIAFHDDGTVTYKTGGWHTYTTKDRLNNYGPHNVSVYQDHYDWFIRTRHDGQVYPFIDGMRINPYNLTTSFAIHYGKGA